MQEVPMYAAHIFIANVYNYVLANRILFALSTDMEPPPTSLEQDKGSRGSQTGQISFANSKSPFPYTISDSTLLIMLTGNAPSAILSVVTVAWYISGSSSFRFSSTSLSRLQNLPSGISQTLSINNPTLLHENTYEAVLWLRPFRYLTQFGCPLEYLSYGDKVGLGDVILDQTQVVLKYYGECVRVYRFL